MLWLRKYWLFGMTTGIVIASECILFFYQAADYPFPPPAGTTKLLSASEIRDVRGLMWVIAVAAVMVLTFWLSVLWRRGDYKG